MRKMLIGSIFAFGLCAFAQLPLKPGAADFTAPNLPDRGGLTTLVDSITGGFTDGTFATNSQDFTDAAPPAVADYYNAVSDDFFVPACDTWSVTRLSVAGNYFDGIGLMDPVLGPAESINVYIYATGGTEPNTTDISGGALISYEGLNYNEVGAGDFDIELPTPMILDGGAAGTTYWITFQANQSISNASQWGWTLSTIDNGSNDAVWIQQSNLVLIPTDCVVGVDDWDTLAACAVNGGETKTDVAFAMLGEVLTKGISVNSPLNLVEGGSTGTFSVVLDAPPCATVTITLSDDDADNSEISYTPTSLMFTDANWNVPQDVTVTPLTDDIDDGGGTSAPTVNTVTFTPSGSDAEYTGLTPPTGIVNVANIDGTGAIDVSPNSDIEVSEDGSTTVTISAAGAALPTTGTVSIDVNTITGDVEIDGNPTTITLSGPGYSTTITINGLSDDFVDGDSPFSISFDPSVASDDPAYGGITPSSITGTVLDADVPSVGVSASADPIVVNEADAPIRGPADTITYTLSHDPQSDTVEIDLTTDSSEATVSPTTVTLTTSNWNTGAIVTVSPVDEFIDDGDIDYEIVASATRSSNPDWDGLPVANSDARTIDNDTAGVTSTDPVLSDIDEDGSTTFTVALTSEPLVPDVEVTIQTDDNTEAQVSVGVNAPADTAVLTFTGDNWDDPQTVTVTGVLDGIVDGDIPTSFSVNGFGGDDGLYNSLTPGTTLESVTVNNIDVCEPVTITAEIGQPLEIDGTPNCILDVYDCSVDPAEPLATMVALDAMGHVTFTTGDPALTSVGEDACFQAFITGTNTALNAPVRTVPTLGEWGMIAFVTFLMTAGVYQMRRRRTA
ncbi:MAG: IPTL-CTERM sorting domain-containing protein [Acidobacteriota bacterium]|nr:IPTL-CTERM sorting domain-containing protein [Acidobacteriota bacterium]